MAIEQLNSDEILSLIRQGFVHLGKISPDVLTRVLTQVTGLAGAGGGGDTDWTQDPNGVWNTNNNIGIGTPTPAVELDVVGTFYQNLVATSGVPISFQVGNEIDISRLGPPSGYHGMALNIGGFTDYLMMAATDLNNGSPFVPYFTILASADAGNNLNTVIVSPSNGNSLTSQDLTAGSTSFLKGNNSSAEISFQTPTTFSNFTASITNAQMGFVDSTSNEIQSVTVNSNNVVIEQYNGLGTGAASLTYYDSAGITENVVYPSTGDSITEVKALSEYKIQKVDIGTNSTQYFNMAGEAIEMRATNNSTGALGIFGLSEYLGNLQSQDASNNRSNIIVNPTAFHLSFLNLFGGNGSGVQYTHLTSLNHYLNDATYGSASHTIFANLGDGAAGHNFVGVRAYADNTAALSAGLSAGDMYHTAGVLKIVT
jgi:hypothetical protein